MPVAKIFSQNFQHLFLVICFFCALHPYANFRAMSSVIAVRAADICNKIPGLTSSQRTLCQSRPDVIVAIGEGARLAVNECQRQFRYHRWNCTAIGSNTVFGHVVVVGSREAGFVYSISSAGVTYMITQSCSRGNVSDCGCDRRKGGGAPAPAGWKWGGCSVDVRYGIRLARKFIDARELEGDARSLMNLHNNQAGRKAVKHNLKTECKCHGVSGSCTMKTCWKTLSPFVQIGDYLMKSYQHSKRVLPYYGKRPNTALPLYLRMRKSKRPHRKPRPRDLVYLEDSPNYCEPDLSRGSLGTVGRHCNRTSRGIDGCDILCCGRGYNTHQYTRTWQCNCKFHWCCYVHCEECKERTEKYACK